MKKILSAVLALVILSGCFCFGFAEEEPTASSESNFDYAVRTAQIIKNSGDDTSMLRIIGKLRPDAASFDFPYCSDSAVSDDGRFVLQFSSEDALISCLDELNGNPDVIYAERDMPVYTGALGKAAQHLSWGVAAIEADKYSQAITPSSDESVTVAVIDTGCEDIDFIKDKLVDGYDFYENDSDAFQDESIDSHGTFLATIVADCVGSLPIKIMPVRVLNSKTGSLINVINGVIYAVDNGADIINLSMCSILNNCKPLEDALDYAEEKGVTVIVCAGNAKSDIKDYCPSHCENVLTVTSIDSSLAFSESFSNFGNGVDLAAPGEAIIGYNASGEPVAMSGTSMSAAFVSAAAAMLVLDDPECTPEQVINALTSTATDMGASGKDDYYGWGIPKLGDLIKPDLKIRNNKGDKIIKYGETLSLTAEVKNGTDDPTVWWYVDGVRSGEGTTFEVSPKSGSVEVTAKLVGSDSAVLKSFSGTEISDSQTVTVKSGFFQKLISFFKDLFRISRIVVQSVTE